MVSIIQYVSTENSVFDNLNAKLNHKLLIWPVFAVLKKIAVRKIKMLNPESCWEIIITKVARHAC